MAETMSRIARSRRLRDRAATLAINFAGSAVIGLILLILAYLIYVALPLTREAGVARVDVQELDPGSRYAVAGNNANLYPLATEALVSTEEEGVVYSRGRLAVVLQASDLLFYRLPGSGREGRNIKPTQATAPVLRVPARDIRKDSVAVDAVDDAVLVAFYDDHDRLQVLAVSLGAATAGVRGRWHLENPGLPRARLLPELASGRLLAIEDNRFLDVRLDPAQPGPVEHWRGGILQGVPPEQTLVGWGPARETLLLVDGTGQIHRFDTTRAALPRLGEPMNLGFRPRWLDSERDRRVSYLLGEEGELLIFVPGSGDRLLSTRLPELTGPGTVGMSDDGAYVYLLGERRFSRAAIRNPFPETGWRNLWLPQWYASYDQPAHVWHPDGGSIGVLSKYGLTPLLFGTFKAAVYGMAMAIPLALGAAVYTGYLMPTWLRNRVKPSIEMLEALPTVVLGFIAGLWAAPLLADRLFFVLALPLLFVLAPLLLSAVHYLLQLGLPQFRRRPPRLRLLAVVYVAAIWLLFSHAQALEQWLFDGALQDWILVEFGLRYDQRNALLVGLAMGIAITPAMFSIVEDAIFAVPRSLSDGSLALGATRWQALSRIVLPAAAPAIVSAVLIGLARGLGETMIVLLATGNTPVMEASLLSGLRSLSASIAAELPEAGTTSVQFRVLFLAALVLFALTFALNTLAEVFRQRLRYSYASR